MSVLSTPPSPTSRSVKLSPRRLFLVLPFKVLLIALAFATAFYLRFDLTIPQQYRSLLVEFLPAVILIKLCVFWYMELGHGWWRYVSIPDVILIVKANLVASAAVIVYIAFVHGLGGVPRTVLVLDFVFCTLYICAVRFITRTIRENYWGRDYVRAANITRVVIVGAGVAGQMIAQEIQQNKSLGKRVRGFVDDDPEKQGHSVRGIRVLGTRFDLPEICQREKISEVIIAIPSASSRDLRAIVELCREVHVPCKTLPGIGELIDGSVSVQQIRDIRLEDLLGRKPIQLNESEISNHLRGKRILVTGAAGSIGSEICRQAARFHPTDIILLDQAETPLFHVYHELADAFPEIRLTAVIADIRDQLRIEEVFDGFYPQVIFHAAAYKHVPLMESNAIESINNNILGTKILVDAAERCGCERFVMISTDKAVNPTNIMGASKRVAELYVQSLAQQSRTQFITVRFGNVLGSAGSVVPIFREQILKGGPVTVTHPEVTRFFMTIPEASQLVLQAGSMGQGGEIFLLDMGEPVKIRHLAEEMIRLCGLRLGEDIDIVYSGLRPGEKLYEELLLGGEGIKPTPHEKILVAASTDYDRRWIEEKIAAMVTDQKGFDRERICALFKELVPEFQPERAGGPK